MPLNISIDVDGTLLDENENPIHQARESLQRLKDAGHCLQLWSAGGAAYAYAQARKHRLTDMFDSYAKKTDVAIDDLPETGHPLAVVHVCKEHSLKQAVSTVLNIEQNVDAALTSSSELINFVAELQAEQHGVETVYGGTKGIIPNIPVHPIPFFGVIEKARIITVGLNPSPTEFMEANRWPKTPLSPHDLARRLVDYFRLPHIAPHHWFAELQWSLDVLHCPYRFAAAHVDVSPWTTHSPTYLAKNSPQLLGLYNGLLADGVQKCLPRILQFCKDTLKLVIICPTSDVPGRVEAERLPLIENTIRHALGPKWNGRIILKPKDQVPRWAWENREEMIRLLGFEQVFP